MTKPLRRNKKQTSGKSVGEERRIRGAYKTRQEAEAALQRVMATQAVAA
jgi:hypothetical protein